MVLDSLDLSFSGCGRAGVECRSEERRIAGARRSLSSQSLVDPKLALKAKMAASYVSGL